MARNDGFGQGAGRRAVSALVIFLSLVAALYLFDPDGFYLWAKAIHVIAVISWMAGMLYLPRLFVYHAATSPGSDQWRTFCTMEQRLLGVIMLPAMLISWAFGLWLAWQGFGFFGGWLHFKILAVVALSALHGHFARAARGFARGEVVRDARYWRLMNEGPTLLMIAIVILVIVKPF